MTEKNCGPIVTRTIALGGQVFRRNGEDGWRMVAEQPGWGDVTFGPDSVWAWMMLAAALDEIERLTPENVEEPT